MLTARRLLLLPGLALCVVGCASSGDAGGDPALEGSAGLAPFPYTPTEIRRANPHKTVLVYRMEGSGRSFIQTMSFLRTDDPGKTRIQMKRMNENGDLLTQPETTTATWEELRDHASFPADATVRTEARVETPGGKFDCWLYTIEREENGVATTARFWFAFDKPGPPVIYETEQAGELTSRMVLLEYRRP